MADEGHRDHGNPYGHSMPPAAPDPTPLTTQLLLREVASLDKIFTERLHGLTERVNAIKEAQEVFHDNLVRVPTDVDKAVGQLKELHEKWFSEKFQGITNQFTERDTRTEQLARAGELALTAALSAAKEAVEKQNAASALAIAKAETGTAKQIDQLAQLFQTSISAMDAKFNDIKDRLLLIEGRTVGLTTQQTTQQAATGSMVNIIGLIVGTVIAVIGLGVAVLVK